MIRWLLFAALLLVGAPAAARERALLVGVSTFTDARLRGESLPGAALDAGRMRDALVSLGAASGDIAMLTGPAATRAAIFAALMDIETASTPGDRAILYLSGHGTVTPAADRVGRSEVFLAADAAPWDARERRLPGAITDAEIGRAIDRLRARGTDVWIVIDSCTGGALLRSRGRLKFVAPAMLGIPPVGTARGAETYGLVLSGAAGGGRLVAFSAAPPGEPAYDAGGGLFTKALVGAMAKLGRNGNFADLSGAANAAANGAGLARFWAAGDLGAPILFEGRSPDLRALAAGLPKSSLRVDLAIDANAAPCHGASTSRRPASLEGVIALAACDHVALSLRAPDAPRRVQLWYHDAGGGYTSLGPSEGLIVGTIAPAKAGFTFVTHDPSSGRALPTGEEQVLLIERDEQGRPVAARTLRFAAGG